jgi:two-component system sensor kinase
VIRAPGTERRIWPDADRRRIIVAFPRPDAAFSEVTVTETFRILLVHSDPGVRALTADALGREFPDARLTAVGDQEALEAALASDGFDISIADYSLRWGDGPAVFESIKGRWAECPVVVFSVSGEDDALLRALERGEEAASGWPQFLTLLLVAVRSARDKTRLEHERRTADERLRESEARFRSVFESATDGIVLADSQGHILSWNRAAEQMFGYSPEEVGALTLSSLMPARYRERHEQGIRREPAGPSRIIGSTIELRGLRRDESEFPIELAVGTWEVNGRRFYSGVIRDITRRNEYEAQLRASNEELRQLSARIEAIQETERAAIAREIHDELGQALTSVQLDIAWVEKRLEEKRGDRSPVLRRLDRMRQAMDQILSNVRRISAELRPTMLDQLGLVATMEWQANEFSDQTGIACSFRPALGAVTPSPDATTAIYRVFQECLTNIARHAAARTVEIDLVNESNILVMTVRDDGRGIDQSRIRHPSSLGLTGMRERCHSLGGELAIRRDSVRGTRVIARIPICEARVEGAVS